MLHLPETAHLYALLNFAQISQAKYLEPELESYLIQTLLRFSEMPLEEEWSLEEADFDKLKNSPELSNLEFLRDIADYCLISSGLMSDHFSSEECNFDQFKKIGVDAFSILSQQEKDKGGLYLKISHNFTNLVEILKCSQHIMHEQINHSPTNIETEGTSQALHVPQVSADSSMFSNQSITYH